MYMPSVFILIYDKSKIQCILIFLYLVYYIKQNYSIIAYLNKQKGYKMLDYIQQYSIALLQSNRVAYRRYFFESVDFNEKLIGVIGDRGIGKTTFLLQYLQSLPQPLHKKLYVTAEHLGMSNIDLFELAETFYKQGGEVFVIDEIHKVEDFEIKLKLIYDYFDMQVFFSGSSAIQLEHTKADLSRRAVLYRFNGLSFREFLELKTQKSFPHYRLEDILENHTDIAFDLSREFKPFEYFDEYLRYGYYPFYFETHKESFAVKLNETINATIEYDLGFIFNIEPKFSIKLKQLVTLICASKPYELNISKLAQRIGINRNTLYQYIYYLSQAKVFTTLKAKGKGNQIFSKPDKLYLGNPNLNFSYCAYQDRGTIRENFFVNQLGSQHQLGYPHRGDVLVDEKYTFEIGGKNKSFEQIKEIPNSYVAADDIEVGIGNKIPLWLFGFLY